MQACTVIPAVYCRSETGKEGKRTVYLGGLLSFGRTQHKDSSDIGASHILALSQCLVYSVN